MSVRLSFCTGFAILISLLHPAVLAADSCAWMSTERLDELLPDFAPWDLLSASSALGACDFVGRSATGSGANIRASHVLRANAAAAAKAVQTIRQNAPTEGHIVDEPALGEFGFHDVDDRSGVASYAGHYKTVFATGMAVLPGDLGFERYRAGTTAFMRAALTGTDIRAELAVAHNSESVAVLAPCPWFDEGTLRKLLPGQRFSLYTTGNVACTAQNGLAMILILAVIEDAGEGEAGFLRDRSCTWAPVAGLGDSAVIGHGCSNGHPRAILQMRLGGKLLIYTFIPNREPTPAERQLLRDLAQAAQTQ